MEVGTSQVLTGTASAVDTGAGSGDGNATVFFNATNISSVTFTYGSSGLFVDPTYQHIGIDNISFTATPEPNPGWTCAIGCGALAAWTVCRRGTQSR